MYDVFRMFADENSRPQSWHCDEQPVSGPDGKTKEQGLSMVIPINSDVGPGNGATEFLLGSHQIWHNSDVRYEYRKWSPSLSCGDVVVFNDAIIHRGATVTFERAVIFAHVIRRDTSTRANWVYTADMAGIDINE